MSTISASTTSTTAYKVTADTTGTLVLQTGATPTTAVTIGTNQVATFAQAPVLPSASIPQAALAAGVAGNGPAFMANMASNQSVSGSTTTKVAYATEVFDTNSCYDPSTYRFQPNVAGYYYVVASLISNGTDLSQLILRKNGTTDFLGSYPVVTQGLSVSGLIYLNGSTDYVETYVLTVANASLRDLDVFSYFQAFLARSA